MSDDKVKVLKKGPELSPEQLEFVAAIRSMLNDALAGKLVGFIGAVCDDEGETGYAVAGSFTSVGEMYLALHNVADMVRAGDLEEILGLEDEEE